MTTPTPDLERLARYRKKPVVIEARPFTVLTCHDVARWCGGFVNLSTIYPSYPSAAGLADSTVTLSIRTSEGVMLASLGDWIIKGIKGEFYPCKPDIFEATYERVE